MFKKFIKNKWLISAILLGLVILFSSLKSVWSGFVYVALPFLTLFCLYWFIILVLNFVEDYYKNFDEEFKIYKAEIINETNITSQIFEENLNFYIKKFKKSLRLDKFIDICKILFVLSIFAVTVTAIIKF